MRLRQPLNERIVRYLEKGRDRTDLADFRAPREKSEDYMECGSHPDVVERVWDQLGRDLPPACRQVVLGSPGLVHPDSGVVLALSFGTQYALRLPAHAVQEGVAAKAKTKVVWSSGGETDIQDEFGPDWIFGTWATIEETWCVESFKDHTLRRDNT